jgi:hypothetical protein
MTDTKTDTLIQKIRRLSEINDKMDSISKESITLKQEADKLTEEVFRISKC